jgi:DNA-binding IclR family transcriptional regulator
MDGDDLPVKATSTSATVIDALLELDGATVTELTNHLQLSKSSVHNHLRTLAGLGYVVREGWTYHVSLQFLEVGAAVRRRFRIHQAGVEEARALTSAGFDASLVVLQDGTAVCIATAAGGSDPPVVEVGDRLPLHCTAGGKAMLAALDRDAADAVLDEGPLPGHTENTITDRAELFDHLDEVETRGLALEREEWREGVRGIGSAVTDSDSTLLGALYVTGSADQLSGKTLQQDASGLVLSSANRIRRRVRQE